MFTFYSDDESSSHEYEAISEDEQGTLLIKDIRK